MRKKFISLLIFSLACALLIGTSSVFAATEEITFGPDYDHKAPFQAANPSTTTPVVFAQKFSFTGKEMTKITLLGVPTWGPRQSGEAEDNSAKFTVYKWNTNYATTIAGQALKVHQVTNHVDGQDIVITFNTPLKEGTYLWVCTDVEVGVGGFGFWGGAAYALTLN